MSAIRPVAPPPPSPETRKAEKLEKATHEFEAIFVRQLLAKSGLGGKGDVYGDLAVGAVSEAVTAGKGIGLGELVRQAVEKADQALKNRR